MTRCDSCRAETSNGLALCDACRLALQTYLEFLPIYYRNLARQRRPSRPNGSLGSAQQWLLRRGEVDGNQIQPALARAFTTLTEWATKLGCATPRGDTEADTFAALCELLEKHINRVAAKDRPGQLLRDIARHENTLRKLTETVVPGWYAGTCQQPSGRDMEGNQYVCGANTYVVPGLTWVTCRRCGATTHASDHVAVVLTEARDWIARPLRLSEAIVVLVDTEHSIDRLHDRIRQWSFRGQIQAIRALDDQGDPTGPKRYRLGDVLDRLQAEGRTIDLERIYRDLKARVTGQAA